MTMQTSNSSSSLPGDRASNASMHWMRVHHPSKMQPASFIKHEPIPSWVHLIPKAGHTVCCFVKQENHIVTSLSKQSPGICWASNLMADRVNSQLGHRQWQFKKMSAMPHEHQAHCGFAWFTCTHSPNEMSSIVPQCHEHGAWKSARVIDSIGLCTIHAHQNITKFCSDVNAITKPCAMKFSLAWQCIWGEESSQLLNQGWEFTNARKHFVPFNFLKCQVLSSVQSIGKHKRKGFSMLHVWQARMHDFERTAQSFETNLHFLLFPCEPHTKALMWVGSECSTQNSMWHQGFGNVVAELSGGHHPMFLTSADVQNSHRRHPFQWRQKPTRAPSLERDSGVS